MTFIKLEGVFAKWPGLAGNRHASPFAHEVWGGGQTGGGFNQADGQGSRGIDTRPLLPMKCREKGKLEGASPFAREVRGGEQTGRDFNQADGLLCSCESRSFELEPSTS